MGWLRDRLTPRRRAGGALVSLVLVAGLAGTAGAGVLVETEEDRFTGQVMDNYATLLTDAVEDQVTRYRDTMSDMSYAIGAQSNLTQDDFARITAGLDAARLTGAGSISFVVPAAPAEIAAVQRRWRAQGATDLTLRPDPDQPKHAFLIFEKAFDDRDDMRGVDLAVSTEIVTALHTAQRSGGLAISPPLRLVRDRELPADKQQISVTLATPVYSGLGSAAPDEFIGWMVMGLRGQDFLAQTFLDHGQGAVHVSLADPARDGATLAEVTPGTRDDEHPLERVTALTAGQRQWQLTIWPTSRLAAATDRGVSGLTAAAGVALSVLLAAMTAVLTGSRNRALERVERATAELRLDIRRREQVETQLRESEEQLRHLAFHDPLTGIANRMLFLDRLAHTLATHARKQRIFAVLFIDLDGFKEINDRRGHDAGDTVLRVTADRLRHGLRATDTVARFGGDEFAIILEDLASAADARPTAQRVIDVLCEPIDVGGVPARVSASVGIAVSSPGAGAADILRDADTAMYAAKTAGKNRYAEAGVTPG
ncbi:diguanylate cyclase domain-containing protein [Catenuloplanes japonicus]|uniref:diguanylate cyclase domain-containing protein n=1 Tax=Catenuloplanes japonicus TaxID=33876 RepID=UPI00068FE72E|nr:diguanylate cyclase [Catenuloplanes japonicus]